MKMVHVYLKDKFYESFLKKIAGVDTMGFNNGEFLSGEGGLAREPFKGLLYWH